MTFSGHEIADCSGAAKPLSNVAEDEPSYGDEVKYIFVRLSVLREYLKKDLVTFLGFSLRTLFVQLTS